MERKSKYDYMSVLWRMVEFGTIEEEDYHRAAGMYYGYNKCCIENYIALTKMKVVPGLYMSGRHGADEILDHVRCPKCRRVSK